MTNKQKQLVQLLINQNGRMSAARLADELGISVRSIHNYIKSINTDYPDVITSTPDGYHIQMQTARKILNQDPADIPQTAKDRCNYILNRLIRSGTSLNLYDLCDEIYISTTTFQSMTGRMRQLASDCDLSLTISGSTIALNGTERNKRKLLSGLLYNESTQSFTSVEALQQAFPSINIDMVRSIVLGVLNEYHYFINDYSLLNLLLHITIAVNRVQNGCVEIESTVFPPLGETELGLAQKVIEQLEDLFNIKFVPAETYELALLLVSRASSLDYSSITKENIAFYIGNQSFHLVEKLLNTIKESYDIDLRETEFFIRFALHIHNLLVRASNNSFCKYPLSAEIRQSYPLIYDVSVSLAGVIKDETNIVLDEDEIAYIALHLGGALEIQKELANRIPSVLFCPSYYNMDTTLADRLTRKLDDKIVLINIITREGDLEQIPSGVLIISTIRPYRIPESPLIVISPFLTTTDILAINRKVEEINLNRKRITFRNNLSTIMSEELFEIGSDIRTKEELIHYMCEKLDSLGYTNDSYERDILERESISTTAFGQFAIPHTLKMNAKKTGMYVYLSKEHVRWNDNHVNLVIMLCFNSNEKKIFYDSFEPLSMLLLDKAVLRQLEVCEDYKSFIDVLVDNME